MAGKESESKNPSPIKTVVVLVLENRSFDHMLGWMKLLNPEIDGVSSDQDFSNPLDTSDPNSARLNFGDGSVFVDAVDPGHYIHDVYEQIFGEPWSQESEQREPPPTMEGFAQNANRIDPGLPENVMNGFKPDLIPVYKELFTQFAVCDKWFCSVPGPTQPNRMYVNSATSHGLTSNDIWRLVLGLPQKTIFDSLDEAGFSFGIYFQNLPATFFHRNLRKLKHARKFYHFDLQFKRHCKEGKLPNYVMIEPRYFNLKLFPGNDDHPPHHISEGQKLVKEVYEALRSSPQWNETLFIITYDEHGGFYDHVPPPGEGVPRPDGVTGPRPHRFKFDRLGVRVPAIFISPWIEAGTVLHTPSGPQPTSQYEHSSIPATVKKIFNLESFLTNRDAWAGTFDVVLNRTTPRTDCPVTLPEPVSQRDSEIDEEMKLSDLQKELVQLAACLRGDNTKDIYPHKLVENMTVAEAAAYCDEALKIFFGECEKARQRGVDEDTVIVVGNQDVNDNNNNHSDDN